MKWIWIVIAPLILASVSLLLWDRMVTAVWDGRFDVPVVIMQGGRALPRDQITSVRYASVPSPEVYSDTINDFMDYYPLAEAESNGSHFVMRMRCHGTTSGLGFTKTYGQFDFAFILVSLADGRTIGVTCPISRRERQPQVVIHLGS